MPEDNLAPLVTPHGHLVLAAAPDAPALDTALRARLEEREGKVLAIIVRNPTRCSDSL